MEGKREFIYADTLDILESYRTHPRETYDDLINNVIKELDQYKIASVRNRDRSGKFIKKNTTK